MLQCCSLGEDMRRSLVLLYLIMPAFLHAKVVNVRLTCSDVMILDRQMTMAVDSTNHDYRCQDDDYLLKLSISEHENYSIVQAAIEYRGDIISQPTMYLAGNQEGKITISAKQSELLQLVVQITD